MLPENRLSTIPVPSAYLRPDGTRRSIRKDQEYGGIGLQDANSGMYYQIWTFEAQANQLLISAPNHPRSVLISHSSGIKEISGTFDQNMNPCVAFVDVFDIPWLYWFDTGVGSQVIDRMDTTFDIGDGLISPRVCLDDKRQSQSAASDIILFYVQDTKLCMRRQRDRFRVEYITAYRVEAKILDVGMARNGRLQLKMKYNGLQQQHIPPPIDPLDPNQPPDVPDPGIPGQPGGPVIPPPVIPPPVVPPNPPSPTGVALGVNLLAGMALTDWGTYVQFVHLRGDPPDFAPPFGVITEPSPGVFRFAQTNVDIYNENPRFLCPRTSKVDYHMPDGPIPVHRVKLRAKVKIYLLPPTYPINPSAGTAYATLGISLITALQGPTRNVTLVEGQPEGIEQVVELDLHMKQGTSNLQIRRLIPLFITSCMNTDAIFEVYDIHFEVTSAPMPAMASLPVPVAAANWGYYSGDPEVSIGNNYISKVDTHNNGLDWTTVLRSTPRISGPLVTDKWLRVTFDVDSTAPWSGSFEPGAIGGIFRGSSREIRSRVTRGSNVPVVSWHRIKADNEELYLAAVVRCVYGSNCAVKNFTVEITSDRVLGLPFEYDTQPNLMPRGV